jgi:hypothetical protein
VVPKSTAIFDCGRTGLNAIPSCTLIRTAFGGCRGKSQLPELIDRDMNGEISVDKRISRISFLENKQ